MNNSIRQEANPTESSISAGISWDELSLHPKHRMDLQKSGLTPETVKAAGIYTARPDYSAPQNQDYKPVNLRWRRLPVAVLAGRPLPAFDSSTIDVTAHGCRTQSTSTSRELLPARCDNP
jgi:hypothetical protein